MKVSSLCGEDETPGEKKSALPAVAHKAWRVVYVLCKTRGYKTITGFFPHKVEDLEPALLMLLAQNQSDYNTWQTRYGLLLWLSLIVLIPFDLKTVDSNHHGRSLTETLVATGKKYLKDSGPTREAAAFFLAKLFTRRDLQGASLELSNFASWAFHTLNIKPVGDIKPVGVRKADNDSKTKLGEKADVFLTAGVLQTIAAILKYVPRDCLRPILTTITHTLLNSNHELVRSRSGVLRKLSMKISQRAAIALLPVKLAPWRYQRGRRLLVENLQKRKSDETCTSTAEKGERKRGKQELTSDFKNEEFDFDEDVLEEAIEMLLQGLRDRETIVRWSAAKGIGRVTNRLPKNHGDDVVMAVLELISPHESHTAWHGACLAIAELARRGLILPSRLPTVLPKTLQALEYSVRQGSHSVGAHVRDSACFVAWAFARAYAPQIFKPYVLMLAQGLLAAAVFDREKGGGSRISGARGAAGAVRTLSALTLRKLTHKAPEFLSDKVIPELASRCTGSGDISERHGACLSVAEIINGLSEIPSQDAAYSKPLTKGREAAVRLIPLLAEGRLLLGKGGNLMREALCQLIGALANANLLKEEGKETPDYYISISLRVLLDNIVQPVIQIQEYAVSALDSLARQHYKDSSQSTVFSSLTKTLLDIVSSPNSTEHGRRGACMALGTLPRWVLSKDKTRVIATLAMAADPKGYTEPETRKAAVGTLAKICERLSEISGDSIQGKRIVPALAEGISRMARHRLLGHVVFDALLLALKDYAIDRRGDVGSWVREAGIQALASVTPILAYTDTVLATRHQTQSSPNSNSAGNTSSFVPMLGERRVLLLFGSLLKQMSEKIARIREAAGKAFESLMCVGEEDEDALFHIPSRKTLLSILDRARKNQKAFECQKLGSEPSKDEGKTKTTPDAPYPIDWSRGETTFPALMAVLEDALTASEAKNTKIENLVDLRRMLISGLVLSCGSRTKHLSDAAGGALHAFMSTGSEQSLLVGKDLLWVLETFRGEKRVTSNLLRALARMLSDEVFAALIETGVKSIKLGRQIVMEVEKETKNSDDVTFLVSAARVYIGILSFPGGARSVAIQRCLKSLEHPFPKVRVTIAEEFYSQILVLEDQFESLGEERYDEILEKLTETSWNAPVVSLEKVIDELYILFDQSPPIRKPAQVKKPTKAKAANEGPSYLDLVKEMGF
ncbi:hypothetical protein AAMO2058_000268800 [Amorphochlora amoebiformis]